MASTVTVIVETDPGARVSHQLVFKAASCDIAGTVYTKFLSCGQAGFTDPFSAGRYRCTSPLSSSLGRPAKV
jgi:hypothetical protein